ncbi:MAG: response regulator [Anaerolineaceae bacterium]|jgi:CheY-like chemotaxis protein|nr:response regulator [Anaerolineaceae bacterium]
MPKVLLVEDDQNMVALLCTLLKMEKFEVVAAEADADFLALVSQESPDALLMDVHLNGLNGLDVVRALRADSRFDDLHIVMTSGLDMREECLRSGANAFLLKPFMPDDLIALLRDGGA